MPKLEFPEIDGPDDMTLRSLILEYREQGVSGQNTFIKAFGISRPVRVAVISELENAINGIVNGLVSKPPIWS